MCKMDFELLVLICNVHSETIFWNQSIIMYSFPCYEIKIFICNYQYRNMYTVEKFKSTSTNSIQPMGGFHPCLFNTFTIL